ncbi:MAG: prepilin peptidase [Firmicutes bacterium]|nr:prepilin peptidase [Bacillota bacterium]
MQVIAYFWALLIAYCLAGFTTTIVSRTNKGYKTHVFDPFKECFCDGCGKGIPFVLTIPLIPYILCGGKAKCCGAKIPIVFLILEFTALAVFVVTIFLLGHDPVMLLIVNSAFVTVLVTTASLVWHRGRIKYLNLVLGILFLLVLVLMISLALAVPLIFS